MWPSGGYIFHEFPQKIFMNSPPPKKNRPDITPYPPGHRHQYPEGRTDHTEFINQWSISSLCILAASGGKERQHATLQGQPHAP